MAMRFQEVANKAGFTAHTIRFYEKEGVLDSRHVRREPNNYRNYSDEVFERLQLIKKFRGVACSLAELKDILQDHDAHARTNQQVIEWMVARYGNFVRLRPPFNAITLMLWGAPAIALLAGTAAVVIARWRRPATPAPLTEDERRRLADLLHP